MGRMGRREKKKHNQNERERGGRGEKVKSKVKVEWCSVYMTYDKITSITGRNQKTAIRNETLTPLTHPGSTKQN